MAAISFRTPDATKAAAFEVIKSYGLSPSQALNMFLAQIAKTKTIPVSLDYHSEPQPNAKTLAAIEELEKGEGISVAFNGEETLAQVMLHIAQEQGDD